MTRRSISLVPSPIIMSILVLELLLLGRGDDIPLHEIADSGDNLPLLVGEGEKHARSS